MHATSLEVAPAQLDDVKGIYTLLRNYSDTDVLLPRSESDIYNSLRDFYVVRQGYRVVACAALLIYTRELGEVRSLAVDPEFMKLGLGFRLVRRLEEDARSIGLSKLMALTYVVSFFQKLGFHVVDMSALPEKVWGACINCHKFQNCDEIAVLKFIGKEHRSQ